MRLPTPPVLRAIDARAQRGAHLPDHRQRRGSRSPRALDVPIAVRAQLPGADPSAAIAAWARLCAHALHARFSRYRTSRPHAPTGICILGHAVDPVVLTPVVADVLAPADPQIPPRGSIVLALDGKTLRGTIPVGRTRGVPRLAVYLPATGWLMQRDVDRKDNDMAVAPRLLASRDRPRHVVGPSSGRMVH